MGDHERLPGGVLVVAGPTAVGKSELAVALATALDAEIVGADSRQVYRWMEVGTAKPPAELRRRVPHHLIDVVDPDRDYDVAAWRRDALRAIGAIHGRGRRAIVCGGTGLYLRALETGLFEGPPAQPEVRRRLRAIERDEPGALWRRLAAVDPDAARRIHANDTIRLIRALEVFERTGRPLSVWHREHASLPQPLETLVLELTLERAHLYARIDERSRQMVAAGLLDELAALRQRFPSGSKAFSAIGYRQAGQCLDGELAAASLTQAVAQATRRYAKRQLTWLRGKARTVPVPAADLGAALEEAERFFERVAKRQGIG